MKWGELGRDFWLFRFGQVISVIGDSCGHIALSWWILEVTGSAAQMASVIAPAMFVRIFLLPLFGPIGDKFSRKWIIVTGDVWRGVLSAVIASMVFLDFYNQYVLISLYVLLAIGSALFSAVSSSIVSQLVPKAKLQKAMQQERAIMAGGSIAGGIAGGLFVTFVGIGGAFLIDALSFFVAAIAAIGIRANTTPVKSKNSEISGFKKWASDLKDGIRVVVKIPLEFWLGIVAALMNFVISPIAIALPVLVKQANGMPAWFLGGLESAVGVGSVLGAISVGWVCKKIFPDIAVVLGIVIIGVGVLLLPMTPNAALPLIMMFFIGIGGMLANIPLQTQKMLALPDEYRSRVGSLTSFMCQIASPFGVAIAGVLISGVGLSTTLLFSGGFLVLLAPLLFLIPSFSSFLRLTPEEAATFYDDNYPHVFR